MNKKLEVEQQIIELKKLLVAVKPKIKILNEKEKNGEKLSEEQKNMLQQFKRTIKLLKTSKQKNLL